MKFGICDASLCAHGPRCVKAEPRAVQCDEETGDSTLGERFYHQGSEQVRPCAVNLPVFDMLDC